MDQSLFDKLISDVQADIESGSFKTSDEIADLYRTYGDDFLRSVTKYAKLDTTPWKTLHAIDTRALGSSLDDEDVEKIRAAILDCGKDKKHEL
jgi:hypothetical protein